MRRVAIVLAVLAAGCVCGFVLNPSLDITQYAHTPWIIRDGVFKDNYRDVDSNRLLRDRDGRLWIGTVERGLIHVHRGRNDVFTKLDGLSGDVVLSLFEDREGHIWVATTGGVDRLRELPITTVSLKQGLSSDATQSVLAATDGSIWISAHDGLTRWKNGLPDDAANSLFEDYRGRI